MRIRDGDSDEVCVMMGMKVRMRPDGDKSEPNLDKTGNKDQVVGES